MTVVSFRVSAPIGAHRTVIPLPGERRSPRSRAPKAPRRGSTLELETRMRLDGWYGVYGGRFYRARNLLARPRSGGLYLARCALVA